MFKTLNLRLYSFRAAVAATAIAFCLTPSVARADPPSFEAGASIAVLRIINGFTYPEGWSVFGGWYPAKSLGIVLEAGAACRQQQVSLTREGRFCLSDYMAGVRFRRRSQRFQHSVQVLGGVMRDVRDIQAFAHRSNTRAAIQPGYALDILATHAVAVRIQADLNMFRETSGTAKAARLAIGFVFAR